MFLQMDRVKVADVDAELHRRRAAQNRELAAPEIIFAFLALVRGRPHQCGAGREDRPVLRRARDRDCCSTALAARFAMFGID